MKNLYWANLIEDILVRFCCYLSYGGTAQGSHQYDPAMASRIRFVDIQISHVLFFGTFLITVCLLPILRM
jgi:hypothetical protein